MVSHVTSLNFLSDLWPLGVLTTTMGKAAAVSKKVAPKSKPVQAVQVEQVESGSDYDSDEDSDTGGVSQRGFEALIKALGPEGVKAAQEEMAQAEDEDEEEDEDEDEDEEEEEDDEMDEDPMAAVTKEMAAAQASEDEVDSDALELDDVGSEFSIDEDAVPVRKVTINNRVGRYLSLLTLGRHADLEPRDQDYRRQMG